MSTFELSLVLIALFVFAFLFLRANRKKNESTGAKYPHVVGENGQAGIDEGNNNVNVTPE